MEICDATTLDSSTRPSFTTAAAVSSQEDSMPKIVVVIKHDATTSARTSSSASNSHTPKEATAGYHATRRRNGMVIIQMVKRSVQSSRIAHHGHRSIRIRDGRRSARVIDHIRDAARSARREKYRQQILHAPCRQRARHLKPVRGEDIDSQIEEAVASHPVSVKALHPVGHLESRPAIYTGSFHPRRLARRIVRHLVLEENFRAGIPIPDHLIFLVVLDEQAI